MDNAERWLREHDPDYGKSAEPDELDQEIAQELDAQLRELGVRKSDIVPDLAGTGSEELWNRDGDHHFVIRHRGGRRLGKRRITRPAILRRGGNADGLYLAIHNDEDAIREYLERDRPLVEWRVAVRPHRPTIRARLLRFHLGRRIRELYAMGAHQSAVASVLECRTATVREIAGSPREAAFK